MNRKSVLKAIALLLFAAVMLIGITACDDDNPTNNPDDFGIVTGTVYGGGRSVIPDVVVSIGTATTTTDANGHFTFYSVTPGANVRVDFAKAGLMGNQKVVSVTKGRTTYTSSTMFTPYTQTFASTAEANITDGLATVVVPANSFVDGSGNPFTGNVLAEFKYFDPTQPGCIDAFPGTFTGTQTDGTETMFESFGFVSANFFQASNPTEALDLATDKTATITAPIPYSLWGSAPDTIPMWYYDEGTGKWMEQGTATKVGNNYVGEACHFSYWNFDHPITPEVQSTLTGRVMTADRGDPVQGAQVVATGVNYSGYNRVYSDANGNFSITVKASATCTLQAFSGLNNSALSEVISTPAAGGSMAYGDLIIDDLSFTLNGKLETTDGDPVTQGYGMIYQVNPPSGSQPFQAWLSVDANGNFSTSAVNLSGSSSLTVQVMFTQRGTLFSSNITFDVPEPGSIVNLGDITMRAGGQIKGRVKISGGDFITSGYINFRQEGATGEGSHYNSNIDEQGYFIITGPPSTTLSNMRGNVYVGGLTYETSLMSLSFPSSGNLNDIGTVTVTQLVRK